MATGLEELTGRTLGDFVLRQRIGEGGFGEVFRAEQPLLGREAVIKILHQRHRASGTQIQRFLREARLASRLDHPYAAHIYAFGHEPDGLIWIAMEYVRGQTLYDHLKERGPMALDQLVPLLDRICEVLQAAHELGIVHRDIKPPNVMVVSRSGRLFPKLLDFGIAKVSADGGPEPTPVEVTPTGPTLRLGAAATALLKGPERGPPPGLTMTLTPAAAAVAPVAAAADPGATVSFVGVPGAPLAPIAPPREVSPVGVTLQAAVAPPPIAVARVAEIGVPLTEVGAAMGSPPYMAPEQWDDSATVTSRTDLYALGVLTFEALTGKRPFHGATAAALAFEHANAPVPPLGPTFPPALDEVLAKVLAKDAVDRYATAIEYAAALRTAAGLGTQVLPALDETLRQSVEASLPQPIAEAVAAFHGARNPHQARDALRDVVTVAVRVVASMALAAASHGGGSTSPAVADALRELHRRALSDEEWVRLSRELVRPHVAQRGAYPVPELIDLLFPAGATDDDGSDLLSMMTARRSIDGDALTSVRRGLPEITRLLRALAFLADYPLVVVEGGLAESWMGVRRPRRIALEVIGPAIAAGQPVLLEGNGRPRLALWPLVQTASPLPGAAAELFFLDGRGRRGARMVALPTMLERHDETVWDWLTERLAPRAEAEVTPASQGGGSPYRGLASFTAEDAAGFVGREREVEVALNRLRVAPMIAVVGPSGAGKSSFVHAGVVPALPDGWTALSVRPGSAPLAALEARLTRAGIAGAAITVDAPGHLGERLRAGAGTTVLIVDQFEELFTLGATVDEQRAYVRALLSAARTPDEPTRVIVTLRDDFLARAAQLPELREALPAMLLLLGTPAPTELARILAEPLTRVGFEFEDAALPERMIREVADTPGALALLSFTAQRLWELRDRHFRQLTRRAYDALGGVVGALAQHAEETLAAMSATEQRHARIALSHLVTAEGTRAILSRGELGQLLGDAAASAVVEKLIAARLLTATEAEGGDDRIELVHEALLVAWPRLATWRREDAEGARLRDQIRAAARQWTERGKASGLLWRGDALAELAVWRTRHPARMTDADEAFIAASLAEARRGRRVRQGLVIGAFAVLGVGVLALTSLNSKTEAERTRAEAERTRAEAAQRRAQASERVALEEHGRQLFLDGDLNRAAVSLTEARAAGAAGAGLDYLIDRTFQVLSKLRVSLLGHQGGVWSGAYLRDGRHVLSVGEDGALRLWDAQDGHQVSESRGPAGRVEVFAVSPDERFVVTAHADAHLRLWDLRTHDLVREFVGHAGPVRAVRFSPDGQWLMSASDDHTARLWNAQDGHLIATLAHDAAVTDVRSDGLGKHVLTIAEDGKLTAWAAQTGARERVLDTAADARRELTVSPDGRSLLSGGSGGRLKLWDIERGVVRREFTLHGTETPAISRLASGQTQTFSADGSLLAVPDGREVAVWRVGTGERLRPLRGNAEVGAIAFAPADARLAVQSGDAVHLWDVNTAQLVATIPARRLPQWLAFAPGGESILIGGRAGEIEIWSTAADLFVRRFDGLGENVLTVAVSADGGRIAACGEVGGVGVWDAATGVRVARLTHGAPCEVTLDRSGREAMTGGDDGRLARWDVARQAVLTTATRANVRVDSVLVDGADVLTGYSDGHVGVIRPDGSVERMLSGGSKPVYAIAAHAESGIAACGLDGTLRIWTPGSDHPATELARSVLCSAIAWSPDGKTLAAASENELTLFRYAGGQLSPAASCKGHSNRIDGVMFPASGLVLTVAEDATLRVWEASTCNLLETISAGDQLVTADGTSGEIVTGAAQHVDLWRLPGRIASPQIDAVLTRLQADLRRSQR